MKTRLRCVCMATLLATTTLATAASVGSNAYDVKSNEVAVAETNREFRLEGIPPVPKDLTGVNSLLTLGLMGTAAALLARPRDPASLYSRRRADNDDSRFGLVENNIRRNLRHGAKQTKRLFNTMTSGTANLAYLGVSGVARGARTITSSIAGLGTGISNGILNYGQVYGNRRSGVARRRSGFFSRLGSRLLKRMGSVGSAATDRVANLGSMATSQVARMGALASDGVARIGEMATDIVDVAAAVPKGVASVASSEKVRDCLLQTMCYASTPQLAHSKEAARTRRSVLRRLSRHLRSEEAAASAAANAVAADDCEVFQCKVVSAGRSALGIFSEISSRKQA